MTVFIVPDVTPRSQAIHTAERALFRAWLRGSRADEARARVALVEAEQRPPAREEGPEPSPEPPAPPAPPLDRRVIVVRPNGEAHLVPVVPASAFTAHRPRGPRGGR